MGFWEGIPGWEGGQALNRIPREDVVALGSLELSKAKLDESWWCPWGGRGGMDEL